MSVEVIKSGVVYNEKEIEIVKISSGSVSATLLSFGAIIQSLCFDGNDVALGYDKVESYINKRGHHGAMVGRYVGRIKDAKFTLNGVEYNLSKNANGINHSHGGFEAFNRKVWDVEAEDDSVIFTYLSVDGEEGYPGNLTTKVKYSIVNGNEFTIEYIGVSDKDTPFNPTNHVYFNLNNDKSKDCLTTTMQIYADNICGTDDNQVSTNEYVPVKRTALDFTVAKPLGRDIDADEELIRIATGHDHTYILSEDRSWKKAAEAICPESGIKLECYTDMPAMTIYTANYLNEDEGKFGVNNFRRQGFCLETSFVPNSVNIPEFPDSILKAGEEFYSKTVYIFSK